MAPSWGPSPVISWIVAVALWLLFPLLPVLFKSRTMISGDPVRFVGSCLSSDQNLPMPSLEKNLESL